MLIVVAVAQGLLLLLLLVLLLRRPAPAENGAARLPETVAALTARLESTEAGLRQSVAELRREQAEAGQVQRSAADHASRALREEISGSISTLRRDLNEGLSGFRQDNAGSSDMLREGVHLELQKIGDRLGSFFAETSRSGLDARDALHSRLVELGSRNTQSHEALRESVQGKLTGLGEEQRAHQERLRLIVDQRLTELGVKNEAKLEQMRATVDEKLQSTLNERLTKSFGQVVTHLGDVQKGLGEMRELATGVSDLKKVFSNVKARGIVGEFQLGMQLEQMFSPDQFVRNARIKPGSAESVEFALKVPDGDNGHLLLPIDAKFPREDWERLEHAYEHGSAEEQAKAGAAFEKAIRTEGKRICEKYIDPPTTLPFAVMFLPTEALYAEVMRRPALHTDLQSSCNVTIAGPSSFMAILTSFQMGFRTIAIQKKGSEVWKILSGVKSEFGKFELLINKVENNVKTVQNTLGDLGVRTRAINRNLRGVTELPAGEASGTLIHFEDITAVAPLLAAGGEDS